MMGHRPLPRRVPSPARFSGVDLGLAVIVVVGFLAYSVLSIVRHRTFRSTGFDLALFEQVIGQYSRFEDPASAIKGLDSIFSDHVSPVLMLLAPVYAVWSDAAALLFTQAALVAASAIPVFMYANPRIGRSPALMLTAAYLLFGGIQEGVWLDFHEVAFAPVIIGTAVVLADRGRWTASFLVAASLLLVKEDLSFLVAAIGVWYIVQRRPKQGVAAIVLGLGWYLLVTKALAPDYTYADSYRLGNITALEWPKIRTTAYLFGAFFGLSLLSPLALLTLPLLAERMLSSHPNYWTLENHYSLTIAPVLALAAADGVRRLGPRRASRLAGGMLALALILTPAFPPRELARPSFYSAPAAYRSADAALDAIPPGASVAATNRLAPHLDGRPNLTILGLQPTNADYVFAATTDATPQGLFPFPDLTSLKAALTRAEETRRVIFERDGVVVLGPSGS